MNKSKISTVYDQNFTPSKITKGSKKHMVYIPTNLPNNGSPRTIYNKRGLSKYFNRQLSLTRSNIPVSPITQKKVNPYKWWSNLYTKEELDAYKHKKSNKYKLIEHMKTRKHLSANQKIQYLNELKNGKKLNNLINKINSSTIPKQNIQNNVNAIKYATEILNSHIKTNHMLFASHANNTKTSLPNWMGNLTNLGVRGFSRSQLKGKNEYIQLFKKIRILLLQYLVDSIKSKKNMNRVIQNDVYQIYYLEKTILAVYYMEYQSKFPKEYLPNIKFKIDKNKLYDVIKKNIFKKDELFRIQAYIVQSFLELIYGKYENPHEIRVKAEKIVKYMKTEGGLHGFYGEVLEDWIKDEYENASHDISKRISNIFKKHGVFNSNKVNNYLHTRAKEPIDIKAKRALNLVIEKLYPNKKNIVSKQLNNMTKNNFKNLTILFTTQNN